MPSASGMGCTRGVSKGREPASRGSIHGSLCIGDSRDVGSGTRETGSGTRETGSGTSDKRRVTQAGWVD